MFNSKSLKHLSIATCISLMAFTPVSQATIVQFETVLGNFEVNLYDEATPQTVNNFLTYVNTEAYNNSFIHRSEPGFVIQGGGFVYSGAWPVETVPANPAVINEPVYSNIRGTISMAKLGGQPNSATSQWFFNLSDNSFLDYDSSNQGYSVFGEVSAEGLVILDQIASLPRYNFGGALSTLPLQNYSTDATDPPDATNIVLITNISVSDATVDSASGLSPVLNTSFPEPEEPSSSSGGGSNSLLVLLLLALGVRKRQFTI
jgi:peptidyl-prolyl cis-trans isomerase A (cyclophilin A)